MIKVKILVVVDMQNDFISGSLGSDAAKKIVPKVLDKIKSFGGRVIFTRDTHSSDYLTTREGRLLPVEHCIKNSNGWQICDKLKEFATEVVDKTTFGCYDLPKIIGETPEEIEVCGLCTDICVISNAMILKAAYPETDISVDSTCCAGVTSDSHNTALDAMRAVQIVVK